MVRFRRMSLLSISPHSYFVRKRQGDASGEYTATPPRPDARHAVRMLVYDHVWGVVSESV